MYDTHTSLFFWPVANIVGCFLYDAIFFEELGNMGVTTRLDYVFGIVCSKTFMIVTGFRVLLEGLSCGGLDALTKKIREYDGL